MNILKRNRDFDSCEESLCGMGSREENNKNYSFWVDGIGEFIHQKSANQNPAFNASIWGTFVGADYYGMQAAMVGGAAGYANNSIQQEGHVGKGDIDFYIASAYGTGYFGDGYLELSLAAAYNRFNNERKIEFPGYDETAKSAYFGWQVDQHVGLGYDYSICESIIEPFASYDLATNFNDGYDEHGGGLLNTHQKAHASSLLQLQIGSNFYQTWDGDWGLLVLKESVSYIYQKPISTGDMTASIVAAPNNFAVVSITGVNHLFSPLLELFYSAKNVFISGTYQGQFNGKYLLNEGTIRLGYSF